MEHRFIQSIATQSLGRAWHHSLEKKLAECARHGFRAIEVFMEDLEYVARSLPAQFPAMAPRSSFSNSSMWDEQRLAAARYINHLCTIHNLDVICLQPFTHYEGLTDRQAHKGRLIQLQFWIRLARIIGTDLIQIPSSFLPQSQCIGDRQLIIADLREVADIGLSHFPPIRFAYEALCWGTHVNKWDEAWEIVQAVDRPNFGTCLDTFNLAGRVFADPASPTGRTPFARRDMARTMEKMRQNLDLSKVFYIELCDGERLDEPISTSHQWHVDGQPTRMTWSRNARLFPFERRGYLPVMNIVETIIDLGFEGYIAFELFSRTANVADDSVPKEHARRGQESWKKLMKHLQQRELNKSAYRLSIPKSREDRLLDDSLQNLARL